jgi:hypothetical protein
MTVLESYRMAAKQIRWLAKVMPATWELIFIDDGSEPKIKIPVERPANSHFVWRQPNRLPGEWTQKEAFNYAADFASGEYLVKCDVDHILTPEAIEAVAEFDGDMMLFSREAGRLTEDLQIEPLDVPVYSRVDDIYVLRKSIFEAVGGYPPHYERQYGQGGKQFWAYSQKPEADPRYGALIYVTPPEFENYHSLERKVVVCQ